MDDHPPRRRSPDDDWSLDHPRLYERLHRSRQRGCDGAWVSQQGLGEDPSPAMVSPENWRIRIDRAKLLVTKYPESAHLLEFYIQLSVMQEDIARNSQPLVAYFPRLRALACPEPLLRFPLTDELLLDEPTSPEGKFFWRVLNQPWAERSRQPVEAAGSKCP